MKRLIYILLLITLIISCTPQRRLERLLRKHPELTSIDSITIHDTIRVTVPEVHLDTIVTLQQLYDTVYLEQEQLKVKVWMDRYYKVYIQGKCDTVYIDKIVTRKIPIRIYEKTPLWKKIINWIFVFLLIITVGYTLYKVAKSKLF
jgi:hypothetical protein